MTWRFAHKTAGQPTLPRNDGARGDSVAERLLEEHPALATIAWPPSFLAGVCHRLDFWTSGLVVAAPSLDALEEARRLFASHTLRKRYLFLTDRDVPWQSHVVDAPLAHHRTNRRKMVWQRGTNTPHRGRWYTAHTELRRLGPRGALHLWEAIITTGVTHQIRLHAAAVGLALLGDRLYGGTSHEDGRFFLHHDSIEGWPGGTPPSPRPTDWPSAAQETRS